MVIGKINSVFAKHHRWMFGGIVLVIIVTFVFYFSTGSIFDISFGSKSNSGIELFGTSVSTDELNTQIKSQMIEYSLMYGPEVFNSEEAYKMAHNSAPSILGCLYMADQRGIWASSDDIDDMLIRLFRDEKGNYSSQMLNSYIENVLLPHGFSAESLKEAARRMIVLARLEDEFAMSMEFSQTKALDALVADNARMEYTVSVASFTGTDYITSVKIDDAQITEYYEANRDTFAIPAEYTAQTAFISFSAPEITTQAANKAATATDETLENFFTANSARYAKNGEIPDFNTVKTQVVNDYIAALAREIATAKADSFSIALYEKLSAVATPDPTIFLTATADAALPVKNTSQFNAHSPQINFVTDGSVVADPKFADIMGATTAQFPLADNYIGENGVYISFVKEVTPSSIKPFDMVKEEISTILKKRESIQLARQAAMEKSDNLATIDKADHAAAFELLPGAKKVETFGFMPPSIPDGMIISIAARGLETGGVSDAIIVSDGAIIVRLDTVKPGELPVEFAQMPFGKMYLQKVISSERQIYLNEYLSANVKLAEGYMQEIK